MRTMPVQPRLIAVAAAVALLSGCVDGAGRPSAAPTMTATPTVTPTPTPTDNGIAILAPAQVLQRAVAALTSVRTYRIVGDIDAGNGRIKFDIKVDDKNLGGRVSIGNGGMEILVVDGRQYVRPDKKFWRANLKPEIADPLVVAMHSAGTTVNGESVSGTTTRSRIRGNGAASSLRQGAGCLPRPRRCHPGGLRSCVGLRCRPADSDTG
ncbi:hypothetical protein [Rhizomonospora bruguierae]|uniref:hypothetical protein n=1 Tax=Rhizomonospora bruguierae TaxID=1581705 RepID=UPI0020C06443|nr:hypothetical protein [Micromonospora sp. NBRC 107566]